jgi:hypothetical protein
MMIDLLDGIIYGQSTMEAMSVCWRIVCELRGVAVLLLGAAWVCMYDVTHSYDSVHIDRQRRHERTPRQPQ